MSSCKYEILTDRDKKILELVEQLKVVDVFTVDNILFKNTKCNRVCQRRLTNLAEFNRIKRWRPNQISSYIYYLGRKPGNIDHSLLISHFVAHINILGGEVVKLKREWLIHEGIRIDLFIGYRLPLFFIGILLLYNVVLVFAVQHGSAICIHLSPHTLASIPHF